jgi:hypothetical protein
VLAAVRRAIPGPGNVVKDYDAVHDAAMLLHNVAVKRGMDRCDPSCRLHSISLRPLTSLPLPQTGCSAGTWIRARATRCGRGGIWSSGPAAATSAATAPTATPASPTPATSDPPPPPLAQQRPGRSRSAAPSAARPRGIRLPRPAADEGVSSSADASRGPPLMRGYRAVPMRPAARR